MWQFWAETDVAFMKVLIDALVADGTVDARRVYVTGISNGGIFAQRLAIDLGDRIAALAAVAGALPRMMSSRAKPKRAVPAMYVHGTEDKVVGYDGMRTPTLSAEETARWWAKTNKAAEKPQVEAVPDKEDDGTTVERWTFEGDAPVVFYKVTGGGHTWPGGHKVQEALLGRVSRDFDASAAMWEFFARHALPEK